MAPDPKASETHHQWEELRLALIMNGGVSLAVWMGGVTNEIFRLVTHQHPVYRGLMELTRSSPRVDVISGTSAGGVNGAALAVALLYGGDFAQLRDVWMKTGAFTDLLRPPVGKNPGSLLRGEDYYLPALEEAFKDLSQAHGTPQFTPEQMPIDLRLTATLLSGHQGCNVDDLGAPVHDVDYRAQFRFERKPSTSGAAKADAFARRETMVKALARAARSTSSFPFAFEPSLVSPEDAGPWLVNHQLVALKTPRHVVDGGVMDNKPFRGAREGIFEMHRRTGVRRVLAYINPDPGDGKPFELPAKPSMPALSQVMAASIIGIPQSQSIADELEEIESHNLAVQLRRESVLSLAAAFKDKEHRLGGMASDLFGVYRSRRLAATFELFVFRPLSNAASRNPEHAKALSLIGKHGKETLKQDFIARGGAGWLPDAWPDAPDHRDNECSEAWGWGLFPVEFASKLMMNMLRMMQSLAEYQASAAGPHAFKPPLQEMPADAGAARAGADWSDSGDHGWQPEQIQAHLQRVLVPKLDAARNLWDWWCEAYDIVDQILVMRDEEKGHWRESMDGALRDLSAYEACVCGQELLAWHQKALKSLFSQINGTARRAACAYLAHRIATVIREASQEVPHLIAALPRHADATTAPLLHADSAAAEALLSLASIFGKPSVEETLYALLQMEVVEFAFSDHETMSSDSLIELVQISGNGKSALGGCEHAVDKLLGLQLAHFAAFYKESWRANDWTYGRLDGASRLVSVLLNARRLHQIYAHAHGDAVAAVRNIAKDSVPAGPLRNHLEQAWRTRGLEDAIATELLFLRDPDQNVPDQLPRCAEAIELRLHLGILRDELPSLGAAVRRDQDNGADPMWSGNSLVNNLQASAQRSDAPFSPEQAVAQLQAGLLAGSGRRGENFTKEAGSDLFTRTLAHTTATLQNTLSSKGARLGPISVLFAALWLPTLGFHFVAQGLTRQSRTAAALHGAMLTVGLALVLLGLWHKGPLEGPLVQFGWLLLGFGLTISIVRAPHLFTVLAIASLPVLAALLYFTEMDREYLLIPGLLVLLAASVHWPILQVGVAIAAIVLAAVYTAGFEGETSSFRLGIRAIGVLVALTVGIAALQASGHLAGMDKRLRGWRIAYSERRRLAKEEAAARGRGAPEP